ncbi:MAG: DUF3991 and TOPRIM domain-containing protein [Lachnospiraceae bacterium]|nr:DUF3991 and TOPRIM domain-containing protein [Lachnospiraceae bacterium]
MTDKSSFTSEELAIAKQVDLTAVASALGYTVRKIGNYHTLKEMDSIRIYNRSHWFRWSRQYEKGENGGSQIDFLRIFGGMSVKEAVFWLLDFAGYSKYEAKESKLNNQVEYIKEKKSEFVLPPQNYTNHYLYDYLCNGRGIKRKVVDYFVHHGLIYESRNYHNIVFKGNDKDGITRFASMRGVFDGNGKAFKCDVKGNDKRYGFNIFNENSDKIVVFEAAIDMMSYMDIYDDFSTNMIALGMVSDEPLVTFLNEHPHITDIIFCLDNDEPGRKATKSLMSKYYELGYEVEDKPVPNGYKDYNEWLQAKVMTTENMMVKKSLKSR